jgi:4-diphosphocytidyl-2-C-methyl-D-erythritol kinase
MLSERNADAVVIWAPAKVNLYLEVLGKRPDGYHEIASLMVAVSRYDTLEFRDDASGQIVLDCDHPGLSTGPDNLVCRAAELLRERTGCRRGARVRLVKRIPLAAGLAGGSSDAAATLAGLNRLWRLGLAPSDLATLGAEIGSDVAFFLAAPAAWCTGRGERVEPARLGKPLYFVLACPPVGLATATVYRCLTVPAAPESGDAMRQAAADGDVDEIGRRLHNRLQPVAEKLCPEVAALRTRLEGLGPAGQLMSGSGTALFALCRDHPEALRVARELRNGADNGVRPRVFIVRSCF